MKTKWMNSLLLGATLVMVAAPAMAEHGHGGHNGGHGGGYSGGHGGGYSGGGRHTGWYGSEIRHFERADVHVWRGGSWFHTHHEGQLGWWWVVGGLWYFYPEPVYPYPDPYIPPVVVVQLPPVSPATTPTPQYWYYCEANQNYYPYIPTCPTNWKMVPVTPPVPVATPPAPPPPVVPAVVPSP